MAKNGQKWPKLAIFGSTNGQHDPRNTNSKYTDQEWPKIGKNCHKKIVKIGKNGQNYQEKIFLPSLQHLEQHLFYDTSHNSHSKYLK